MYSGCDVPSEHVGEEVCGCITQVLKLRAARLCRGCVPVLHANLEAGFEDTDSINIGIQSPATLFLGHASPPGTPNPPPCIQCPMGNSEAPHNSKKKYNKPNNNDVEGGRKKKKRGSGNLTVKMKGGGGKVFAFCFSKDKV